MMRHLKFTWEDITEYFESMITNGPAFHFDMSEIPRLRKETRTLISNLSVMYLEIMAQEKAEKEKSRRQVIKKKQAESSSVNFSEAGVPSDSESSKEDKALKQLATPSSSKKNDTLDSSEVESSESFEVEGGGNHDEDLIVKGC